jgi:hypothetical protein
MLMEKHYIPSKKLAERWDTTTGVLANWRYRGEGPPYYRVGRKKILYCVEEVEAWLQRGKQMNGESLGRTKGYFSGNGR